MEDQGSRRIGLPDLQDHRSHTQNFRRRGGVPARPFSSHLRNGIHALAHARGANQEVQLRQAYGLGEIRYHQAQEFYGSDGLQSRVVRRYGAAVPDGVPARVLRADLQSFICQFLGS